MCNTYKKKLQNFI